MNLPTALLCLSVALISPCATTAAEQITHSFFIAGSETAILSNDGKPLWSYPAATRDGFVLPNGNLLLALSKNKDYPGGAASPILSGAIFSSRSCLPTTRRFPSPRWVGATSWSSRFEIIPSNLTALSRTPRRQSHSPQQERRGLSTQTTSRIILSAIGSWRGIVRRMEKVPYQGHTLTRWHAGNSTFLALPERGARLMNWNIALADGSVREVLHWPENSDLGEIAKVRGGNPILFPFSARCFDRGEIAFWRAADGVRRPMPMHGIARQGEFKVTRLDARGFTAQLVPGAEAQARYPFDYEFTVTYRFEPLGLSCEFALTNLGREPLPWSAGHHFYFTLPWSDGTTRKDYFIHIPAAKRLRQDATGALVAGPQLQIDESIANPSLIDTLHTALQSNEVVFGENDHAGAVTVRLGTEKVPPPEATFVTWTLAEDSPFYCVEPWMGPPNAPEHGLGLHHVAPGATQKFTVSISVK